MAKGFEDVDLENIDKEVTKLDKQIADIENYLRLGKVPGQAPTKIPGFGRVDKPIPVFSADRQKVLDVLAELQDKRSGQISKAGSIAQKWNARLGDTAKKPKLLTKYLPQGEPFRATGVPAGVTARPGETAETPAGPASQDELVRLAKDWVDKKRQGPIPPQLASFVDQYKKQGKTGIFADQPAGTGAGGDGQGAGGPGGGPGGAAARRRKAQAEVSMDELAQAVQQFFPNYTAEWLSENGVAHFGQDLIDLFRRVAAPGSTFDLTTTEGKERVRAEIRKTVYWQTTLTAAKNFDQLAEVDRVNTLERTKQRLAQTYGNIGLDNTTLNELALNVARNGLTGIGEQQAVYNTVFRTAEARPSQAQRALEGVDADRIRSLGRAYNFDVTNEQIQSILTGTPEASTGLVLTEDGLRERMQKAVKGAMPQLAEQIDAGLTLDDISRNYKRYAAQLLERDENEINMFEGPYLEAFGNREQGQLSLGEWTQKVKSDPRFGWQFTNQANRQASDIALTIARAFGKVQ